MPVRERAKALRKEMVAPSVYRIAMAAPQLAGRALPGQFITVRVTDGPDPLLRRPISIHRAGSPDPDSLQILFTVKGRGTQLLSRIEPGDEVDILGPLGRGFAIDPDARLHCIVAGGMGVAPMPFLAEKILAGIAGKKGAVRMYLGAKSKDMLLCVDEMKSLGVDVRIATDEGDAGYKGLVTRLFDDEAAAFPAGTTVSACGPFPMLRGTAAICARRGLSCQVSMESRMACGMGACYGCVIPASAGAARAKSGYLRVCEDGPVFDAAEIGWEDGSWSI